MHPALNHAVGEVAVRLQRRQLLLAVLIIGSLHQDAPDQADVRRVADDAPDLAETASDGAQQPIRSDRGFCSERRMNRIERVREEG